MTRRADLIQQPDPGPWHYEQLELGYNYRLTDIQAALGLSQAKRIDAFVDRRRELVHHYNEALADLPLTRPWRDPSTNPSWHLYVIRLALDRIKKTHRQVFEELRGAGIGVNLHYIPVHFHPFYRNLGFKPGAFPEAERYYQEAITLPLFTRLSLDELNLVVTQLRKILLG
jgi:dTDP-4-amino-4,6-dideoxygalactose transaminase